MPRLHAELYTRGERYGRKRITLLMHSAGLAGVSCRRAGVTTTGRDKSARPAHDLVDRNFMASRPNHLWVADSTFVPMAAGSLFVAVVLDAWSQKLVGMVHGELLAHRTGARRARHGNQPAAAAGRDPSF